MLWQGKLGDDMDYIRWAGEYETLEQLAHDYNDLMETKAIKKVFGRAAYKVPISSTKSMLGHSFGASGALELICCLLAMRHHEIPPTINFEVRDAECDLDYVPNVSRRHTVSVAMTESAGFGGQNSVIVVGEA
jgi:3-oxoacyl-(acyl-carrier-protein) synthase